MQRLNPGNNSLREIPAKKGGAVALPLEQFYLTTELSNVVDTKFSSRDPAGTLAAGGNAFSSATFPSTDFGF